MFAPTKIYFIIFGLITIAGGVMGYVKAGSTASLIAGSISGILLLVAAFLLPSHVMVGLAIGGIVSLLLAVQFLPAFFRTGKMMPAGMMSLLSILGIVFAIAAWMRK
ncbi:MAG: TMEM14 family protein [Chthoniobacterales bacterium]